MMDNRGNVLFPIFLKLEQLKILIVGGGVVGLEKLEAVANNSPQTDITLVAIDVHEEIWHWEQKLPNLKVLQRAYDHKDLERKDLVILATNDDHINKEIIHETKKRNLLTNVADTPAQCDFYLGSIVKKGDLKIAISTNGKSPTVAKRIKEDLNKAIPNSIDDILSSMSKIRNTLVGDFEHKVKTLNEVTKKWISNDNSSEKA